MGCSVAKRGVSKKKNLFIVFESFKGYMLIPWNRGLPEKRTGPQLGMKFPHFMGYEGPPVPILRQIDPVNAPHRTSGRSILILFFHLLPRVNLIILGLDSVVTFG
jgi:hypothetical protein